MFEFYGISCNTVVFYTLYCISHFFFIVAAVSKPGLESAYINDFDEIANLPVGPAEEGSPVRVAAVPPITVRHPHAIFQSANLYLSPSGAVWNSVGASGCNAIDSSPLSAADFVSGREQLVTASWDRLVTSSRDCTFRLWDFRQPGMRVHVQQAHSQQSRVPVVSIRTDAAINRLSLSGYSLNLSNQPTESNIPISSSGATGTSNDAQHPSSSVPSQAPQHGSSLATSFSNSWTSNFPKYIALPLVNRGIKLFDVNGNRIGRLTRSSHVSISNGL
ncbi:unnamed protein product [Trichobilharzia regenti]|nr:unnamed protein product [Trichobilharzia regenti]